MEDGIRAEFSFDRANSASIYDKNYFEKQGVMFANDKCKRFSIHKCI